MRRPDALRSATSIAREEREIDEERRVLEAIERLVALGIPPTGPEIASRSELGIGRARDTLHRLDRQGRLDVLETAR